MQTSAEKMAALRRLVADPGRDPGDAGSVPVRIALGHAGADAILGGGLERAALHEVFAAGVGDEAAATGFVAGLAARVLATESAAPGIGRGFAWIETRLTRREDGLLWPPGLAEWGLDPRGLVRIGLDQPVDALRAAEEVLACSGVGVVVLELRGVPAALDLVAQRRLALAARQRDLPCLMLRTGTAPMPSPATARFSIAARPSPAGPRGLMGAPAFDVSLIRHRAGVTGTWSMEWDPDGRTFREPVSESAVSKSLDRSDRAHWRQAG